MYKVVFAVLLLISTSSNAALITNYKNGVIPDVGGVVLSFTGVDDNVAKFFINAEDLYSGVIAPQREESHSVNLTSWIVPLGFENIMQGGLMNLSIRMSIFDGDTGKNEADHGKNYLYLNGTRFGNFSDVETFETSREDDVFLGDINGKGFEDNVVSTGWFEFNDSQMLADLYDSILSTNKLELNYFSDSGKRNFIAFDNAEVIEADAITPVSTPSSMSLILFAFVGILIRFKIVKMKCDL